jgi:hypothetical protein
MFKLFSSRIITFYWHEYTLYKNDKGGKLSIKNILRVFHASLISYIQVQVEFQSSPWKPRMIKWPKYLQLLSNIYWGDDRSWSHFQFREADTSVFSFEVRLNRPGCDRVTILLHSWQIRSCANQWSITTRGGQFVDTSPRSRCEFQQLPQQSENIARL